MREQSFFNTLLLSAGFPSLIQRQRDVSVGQMVFGGFLCYTPCAFHGGPMSSLKPSHM